MIDERRRCHHLPVFIVAAVCGATVMWPGAAHAHAPATPGSPVGRVVGSHSYAVADDPLPIPEPSPQEANDKADEILARPEYQEPPKSLFQRFMDWLSDLIGSVMEALIGGSYSGGLAWLVIAVLVGLSVLMVLRFRRSWSKVARAEPAVEFEVVEEHVDWLAAARSAEAEGDWRTALLYRYRALVGMLVDRGVLTVIPGRTVGEIRRDLAANEPEATSPFTDASMLFEDAWYGNAQVGPGETVEFDRWAGQVADRVSGGSRR